MTLTRPCGTAAPHAHPRCGDGLAHLLAPGIGVAKGAIARYIEMMKTSSAPCTKPWRSVPRGSFRDAHEIGMHIGDNWNIAGPLYGPSCWVAQRLP